MASFGWDNRLLEEVERGKLVLERNTKGLEWPLKDLKGTDCVLICCSAIIQTMVNLSALTDSTPAQLGGAKLSKTCNSDCEIEYESYILTISLERSKEIIKED